MRSSVDHGISGRAAARAAPRPLPRGNLSERGESAADDSQPDAPPPPAVDVLRPPKRARCWHRAPPPRPSSPPPPAPWSRPPVCACRNVRASTARPLADPPPPPKPPSISSSSSSSPSASASRMVPPSSLPGPARGAAPGAPAREAVAHKRPLRQLLVERQVGRDDCPHVGLASLRGSGDGSGEGD